ncbi:MAG: SLC13 family permease [Phycisphaerales bacterium]|nr:SLC13 family permease [Phycisphaerales bacterium]
MWQQVVVFAVLTLTLALFLWGRWRYDLVALLALLILALLGIVPPREAFTGFTQPAVVTVAAVLVLSRALTNAGVVDLFSRWAQRIHGGITVQLLALTGLVTLLSGFINNVGALSLLMPVAIRMARSRGVSASLFLMPLAFGSLLGGMTTLIGTPPNLLVSNFRLQATGASYRMFDFAVVGGAVALTGVLFIALLGWRLVPKRTSPKSAEDLFEIGRYFTELRVSDESRSIGRRIRDIVRASETQILVTGLVRGKRRIDLPMGLETLSAGERLIVEGAPEDIDRFVTSAQLELVAGEQRTSDPLKSEDTTATEVIVLADGYLVNRSPRTANLRWRFGVNVLAVARQNARLKARLADIRFRPGDILLLQGPTDTLPDTIGELGCLPLAERSLRVGQPRRILQAVLIFGLAVILTSTGQVRPELAFVGAALACTWIGLVPVRGVYDSIDWSVIVLLGAMIPVGVALETTGAAALAADGLLYLGALLPPSAMVVAVLLIAMFLSDILNNAAAVVLLAPIALRIASALECSPDPFLMALAIGASCAFLTPIGHQSNTLVLSPGGYRFGDYWRLGLPLQVVILLVAVPLLLFVWPLRPGG